MAVIVLQVCTVVVLCSCETDRVEQPIDRRRTNVAGLQDTYCSGAGNVEVEVRNTGTTDVLFSLSIQAQVNVEEWLHYCPPEDPRCSMTTISRILPSSRVKAVGTPFSFSETLGIPSNPGTYRLICTESDPLRRRLIELGEYDRLIESGVLSGDDLRQLRLDKERFLQESEGLGFDLLSARAKEPQEEPVSDASYSWEYVVGYFDVVLCEGNGAISQGILENK